MGPQMTPATSKPTVLAITKDHFFLRNIRLAMPLLNLKRQGLIADYFITNPLLFDLPDDFVFDVVWLQRVDDPALLNHLAEKIDSRYLFDLDDLLVGRASYRGIDLVCQQAVLEAIRKCRILTVTSTRLGSILERYVGLPLGEKTLICPNGFEFSSQIRIPAKPTGIILTSSDKLPLNTSFSQVMDGLAEFTGRHDLPIYYFGRHPEEVSSRLRHLICLGLVPYWHYQALLAAWPPMIGMAPLETVADPDTLDFISCKSDVKMVEFGGHGHPGVYSQAPPYVDSDLQAGVLVENTAAAWLEGLERLYRDLWQRLAEDQRHIIERSNMTRIARQCWFAAISAVRLPRPLAGREIKFSTGKIGYFLRAFRHLVYEQDYLFLKRLQRQIPPVLMKIIKKFY
jgi:hypothetical protein